MATWALFKRLFGGGFLKRVLLAVFVIVLLLGGVELRHWTWDKTRHVRYQHDIVNGLYWGSETLKEARNLSPNDRSNSWSAFFRGYLSLYDRVKDEAYEGDYGLDYPPLRLLVMSIWAKQVRSDSPAVDDGHPSHVKPLLNINFFCELLSAVGIFFLVNLCVKRASTLEWRGLLGHLPAENRGWICGLAAASFAWFEPSTILDAHGWPQWDVWIVPLLLVRSPGSVKESLVFMWLSAGGWSDAQGPAIIRGTISCLLATVAKRLERHGSIACGLRGDECPRSFALAVTQSSGLDFGCPSWICQFWNPRLAKSTISGRVGCRNCRDSSPSCRRFCRRQFCLAANWLPLRQRALPLSLRKFMLQPAVAAR